MRKKELNAFKAKVDRDAAALVEHICEYSIQRICRRRVTCAMPAQAWKQVLNAIHHYHPVRQGVKDDKGTVF